MPDFGNRPESVDKYLKKSLQDLKIDYVDMYLVHTPWAVKEGDSYSPKEENGSVIFETADNIAVWKVKK